MSTTPPVSPPVVDDQYVTQGSTIDGIPLFSQGDDLLCGYFCVRMIRAAASVGDDPVLETRREAGRYGNGLSLAAVAGALRRVRGWDGLVSARGPAEAVWEEVAQAARSGRPSVLWLPRSEQHKHGHYVVVTGVDVRDPDGQVLRVQDPTSGVRWMAREEWSQRSWGVGSRSRRAFIAPQDWRS